MNSQSSTNLSNIFTHAVNSRLNTMEQELKEHIKADYKQITEPIGMLCQLSDDPQPLMRYPDVFQEILDEIDPVENLPLQNYLHTVLTRMRRHGDITEEVIVDIIKTSDTEMSSRKRKRTTPSRDISKLDKSDLLHYLRVKPPMYSNDEPYTVDHMKTLTRAQMERHIMTVFPGEFY